MYYTFFLSQGCGLVKTDLVDDDVQLLPNVNVVVPIVQPFLQAVSSDLVHVVAFSTIYDLDFQLYEGNHCKPTTI